MNQGIFCFGLLILLFPRPMFAPLFPNSEGKIIIQPIEQSPDSLKDLCIERVGEALYNKELSLETLRKQFLNLPSDLKEPLLRQVFMPFFNGKARDSYTVPESLIVDLFSLALEGFDIDSYKKICYLLLFNCDSDFRSLDLRQALLFLLEQKNKEESLERTFLKEYRTLLKKREESSSWFSWPSLFSSCSWEFNPFYLALKCRSYHMLEYIYNDLNMRPSSAYWNYESHEVATSILNILKKETAIDDFEMQQYLTMRFGIEFNT